ncbi:MAG: hypothetical protein RBU45_12015 [Myxococcota bacterium]|jgi:hypothetical protein|nr:hypothetical protein [Myxococcota bacterium]
MSNGRRLVVFLSGLALLGALIGCGDDDEKEADRLGIGAQCTKTEECAEGQECLTAFKGGLCGVKNCSATVACPEASVCVVHDDGINYCFRTCVAKADCNAHRDADNEANCSSSVTFLDPAATGKACVPSSGN